MKSFRVWVQLAAFGGVPLLTAQTSIDLRTQTKSVDFSSAVSTKPSKLGTVPPAFCSVGETFFNTAAPAGHNFFGCTAPNAWTLLGTNLWFGGGSMSTGDCAKFDSSGNIVSAGAACGPATAITVASPFAAAGSLLVSAGAGRQSVASLCTDTGGTLSCPGGFSGRMAWLGGTGSNSRQILGPAGSFSNNFNYRWTDTIPTAATLMKIGTPASGESSLGPATPDADYVTPSGVGALQNKSFDGTNTVSSYLPWVQVSKPGAPAAGYLRLYAKTGGGLCWINSSGTETCAGAGTFGDPGGTGVVVETSPGVTANRTITAGSANVSVTNGTGAAGNPIIDIGPSVDFSGKTTSPVQVGTIAGMPSTCSLGQVYFNTSSAVGQNLYFCTATNTWSQMRGAVPTVFGRSGAVTAQAGDYTYAQISNTPAALPPNGAASGDLSGTYPSPTVSQVNGGGIPTSGVLKANGSRQIVAALPGTDYAPPTSTPSILKGNGAGGFSSAAAADVVSLFAGCSGAQYLGADGACHAAVSGGAGYLVLTTGNDTPAANCAAPSATNLAVYLDTTNGEEWWCYATNSWKKTLSVTGSGPYMVTGAIGSAPSTPSSGFVSCYFDNSLTQVCIDSSGGAWQMVKQTTLAGLQKRTCDIPVGDTSGSTVTNAQLGPQKHVCKIPQAATVLEVDIDSDAGSPSVVVARRRCTTFTGGACSAEATVNLVTLPLSASSGYAGCSNAAGSIGLDGGTACLATLQNTALNAGDWIELAGGTASSAKLITVHVVYSLY